MSEGSLTLPVGSQREKPPHGGPSPQLKRFVSSLGSRWHLRWSWGPQVQPPHQLLRGNLSLKARSSMTALPSGGTLIPSNISSSRNSGSCVELGISGLRLPSRASLTASSCSSNSNSSSGCSSQQHRLRSFPLTKSSRHSLPPAKSLYMASASGGKTSSSSGNSSSSSTYQQQQSVGATPSCTPSPQPTTACLQTQWEEQQQQEEQRQQRTEQRLEQPDEHPNSFLSVAASAASPLLPNPTAEAGPYGLSPRAAEYLTGVSISNNSSKSHTPDLPPEVLAIAARAMRGAEEEVRLARARMQEKQLQRQQQQRLQQKLKAPTQQRQPVNLTAADPQPLQKVARKCRLDEGSYYTFKSAKVNGVTVELKNRGEVAASIHRLHCEYGIPLCREFGFRYFFLAEQHPLHRKAGSVIRKPLNSIKERLDELQLQGRSRNRSNTDPQARPAAEAASSSTATTRWSYCIRIRMRQLQKPQQLLQLPTQLGIFFHELAHLRYMNHGLGFACLLARIFRYATERGLFEPGWETELPSPWLWERVLFYCGGFVTDTVLQQLLLADPKARAAAGTACNLDAPTSASVAAAASADANVAQLHAKEKQAPDEPAPAAAATNPSATQATAAVASTDSAVVEPAPASGAASAAVVSKRLTNGRIKQEAAQGSAKNPRMHHQQQQVLRQRRTAPTVTLRRRASGGSVGVQKASMRSKSSNSSSSISASHLGSGKAFASVYPTAPIRHQQRQQKLQQPQPQRRHHQLLKHRSSINSSSSSTSSTTTRSSCRSSNRRRGSLLS